MGFALNTQQMIEIDIAPSAVSPEYKRLAVGISGAELDNNENVDDTLYLDGDGYASSFVLSKQLTAAISGHRFVGDPAQDFIASLDGALGEELETRARITDAQGNTKEGSVTITDIKTSGGDAGGKTEFSCTLRFNGKPNLQPTTPAPSGSATVAKGSAVGTTKATVSTVAGEELAYKIKNSSLGTIYKKQFIGNYVSYVSTNDIVAEKDQYLGVFVLDSDTKRVKAFDEFKLTAAYIQDV